ncbi:MAG: D-alanine--D-alanine ligase [Saprospiraceae bacterium]|nr:D-alanine--D-alanine ligase [Saprospiraceae bacterium]
MKRIAILTGGLSAERAISLKSAEMVAKHLDPNAYDFRMITMNSDAWVEMESHTAIDLNDFSLTLKGRKEFFDFVFLIIHGTPAEDGKMQGYFEMMDIPHSTCDTLASALTFNKQKCKEFLEAHQVPMAPSLLLKKGDSIPRDKIEEFGYPLFVKPNSNGSSYGISLVKEEHALMPAVETALRFDQEVIIEGYLEGAEFGCGLVREGEEIHVFPVTEIIPRDDFFTYEAKYEGASEEITPARISPELTQVCQDLSERIYTALSCRGMVRMDYILVGDAFYFLEVNTIPGLSAASIIPQQASAYGWDFSKLLDVVIKDCSAPAFP